MKNWVERIKARQLSYIDLSLFLLLFLPYIGIFFGSANSNSTLGVIGLLSIVPVAILVMVIQIVINRRENHLDVVLLAFSIFTLISGLCVWIVSAVI